MLELQIGVRQFRNVEYLLPRSDPVARSGSERDGKTERQTRRQSRTKIYKHPILTKDPKGQKSRESENKTKPTQDVH